MKALIQNGFTLIELMIALAIIGIVSAIALPFYANYQAEARAGVARSNIQSIHMLQLDRKREFGEYVEGSLCSRRGRHTQLKIGMGSRNWR